MNTLPLFVGLDYHQSTVQVCVMDSSGRVLVNRACQNHWQVIAGAVGSIGTPTRVAIEACTGASDLAQELVDHAGWSVDLAHAAYVARMKRQPDKTDYSDARMLADLTRVGYLPRVWLPPVYIRDLRRLVSLRQALVAQRTSAKLRLTALRRDHRVHCDFSRWTKRWLAWVQNPATLPAVGGLIAGEYLDQIAEIQRRIGRVEEQLELFTSHDPIVAFLRRLGAIGQVTAWSLRAGVGDVTRFKNGKQLSHYCGLSPANASSGARVADAGLISSGNTALRSTLMELAHRLSRTDGRWRQFKEKLKARGKAGSLIAAGIANRYMRGLYYPWKQMQQSLEQTPELASQIIDRPSGEVLSRR
jgi:transposase